ncbi:Oligopeptide transport ATP-binding protein OppD [Streptomyces sp. YIM 130001]|uniref:ABC transporter ATP-binding protein n=1 Tax=Streptomyces sp. YIM 130001 TaxID=2259644 RepID=UPI000E6562F9|nr:ABC transporter ATP-binding protein [Streptomyces sp. YIM 130001]RII20649.1 Oligopeptide transport ATP-binding protein OppD [Streptomyces sp. YIM 130001]
MKPLLSTDRLGVTTAGRRGRPSVLLREVGLDVAEGQTLGIVGESGSGKSLTARAITGLLPRGLAAHGSVHFDGQELVGATEKQLRPLRGTSLSLLLQDPFTMLNPLQTAGAGIAESLPGPRRDRAALRDEVVRRLDEVNLPPDVADRRPYQLSGGMRQRVSLACALAGDPRLLIADEPTTALDATTQDDVLRLLKDIQQRRGMALILITHDLRVAFDVCDRIHVMYAGSVLETGPAKALEQSPAHPYSHGLLRSEPPLGHYADELVSIPGSVPSADSVGARCAFADRCQWAEDVCTTARPPLEPLGDERASACLRLPEIDLAPVAVELHGTPPPAPAASAPTVAALTDVRKTFRSTPLIGRPHTTVALQRVSLEVREGECVGLVGETGSGKSTIARCLLGLASPDSGRIDLGGVEITGRRRPKHAHTLVQAVFQDPYSSLNPSLTIGTALREAAGQGPGNSGDPAELLTRVGLPASYAARRPAALSGGERQRVAIARALAVQPRLLICDEPVAALDVSAQAQILELLRDIRRSTGMSMLFITHDLSVVRQMADRLVVLLHGEVVEYGATDTVLGDPRHDYTRQLIEAVPGAPAVPEPDVP